MIPYGRQSIDEEDVQAVVEVLHSDFLTQGPMVPAFEGAVAEYCGSLYAVAVNSATSALHIACLALGVGKGDIVWTSPITFVASANCALYCGASVDFVDIDPATYNMSVDALRDKLEKAEKEGRLPKVVIPVHFAGQSCVMREIRALADHYGFRIIEDAAHAIGGKYLGEPVGCCRYSDITVFSFHPVKIITTGEGGMALTNDKRLARRMQLLRSHGVTRDADEMTHSPEGQWYYQQVDLGFNYRMTDIQAAIGVSQMRRLDDFVIRRHQIADEYKRALEELPLILPVQLPDCYSSYHLYPIRVHQSERGRVFNTLRENGVGVNVHYIPVYRQPHYVQLGFKPGLCPEAEHYYAEAISLPMCPILSEAQQWKVIESLKKAVAK